MLTLANSLEIGTQLNNLAESLEKFPSCCLDQLTNLVKDLASEFVKIFNMFVAVVKWLMKAEQAEYNRLH